MYFKIYLVSSRKYALTDCDVDRLYKALNSIDKNLTPYNSILVLRNDDHVFSASVKSNPKIKAWESISMSFPSFKKLVLKKNILVVLNKSFKAPSTVVSKLLTGNRNRRVIGI